jgi:transposase-like protein
MEAKRKHIVYKGEFRRQAVEIVIHSGKTQAQVARELGCSEYNLNLWKKADPKGTGRIFEASVQGTGKYWAPSRF